MRTKLALSVLVILGLAGSAGLAACSSTNTSGSSGGSTTPPTTATPAADPLAGTAWKLNSFQGPDGAIVPAAPNSNATLDFDTAGGLGGSICNQFGGTYTVDGQKLSIQLGPMTQMACGDPRITAEETAVIKLLPQVTSFDAAGGKLTLADAGGAVLLTYSTGLTGIEGTSWKATGVNNGTGGVETSALTESLTATFGAGGAFTGSGGCNDLSGTYQASGTNGLTITGLTSSQKACSVGPGELENRYTAALGQVTTYTISGDTLTLRNADGATQVTYRTAA
jgi:heat shock protein HslJ